MITPCTGRRVCARRSVPHDGHMDPQITTLLAGIGGGVFTLVGTLGTTWLNNKHQAKQAADERAAEEKLQREERAAEDRSASDRRRDEAATVVRSALMRVVEAASVGESLRLEVDEAKRYGHDTASSMTERDRRVRAAGVISELGKISAEMTAFGGELALYARSLLEAARASLQGNYSALSFEQDARMFEAAAATWLQEHARVSLGGTEAAQTAPDGTRIERNGTDETGDASK